MAEFSIIGFTLPGPLPLSGEEAEAIKLYLDSGAVDIFHIRKPDAEESYVRSLLKAIPSRLHGRLMLHSHFNLFGEFSLRGVHRKTESAAIAAPAVSRSCHILDELLANGEENLEYSFLSPIFDSISKPGYASSFDIDSDSVRSAVRKLRVIALGGVKPQFFKKLFDTKFAGAALLGYLWSSNSSLQDKVNEILLERNSIKHYI